MSLLRGVSFDHLRKSTREYTLLGCFVRSDKEVVLILQHAGEENAGWINAFRKVDAASPLKDLSPRQHFDAVVGAFCEFVVVGWKHVNGEDGKPVEFTAAGCLEVMRAYADAALDLASRPIFFASHANNFRDFKPPVVDAEALGKT
jgi:hypothetical protein